MQKKIIGILVCTLVIATCLPVTGTINSDKNIENDQVIERDTLIVTPIWDDQYTIYINIFKIWVFDCSDTQAEEPAEFFFHIFAFPAFRHIKTNIYEVTDNHPETSYDFGLIGSISTHFTPQVIVIQAMEEDKKFDLNPNDVLGRIVIKLAPPKGEYSPSNPYSEPKIRWKALPYFEADISISFYHS